MARSLWLSMVVTLLATPCFAIEKSSHEKLAAKILEIENIEPDIKKGTELLLKVIERGIQKVWMRNTSV